MAGKIDKNADNRICDLLDGLYEEYKIIQTKIDKIADFGLKVRGWCITIQSALVIALVSEKFDIAKDYYVLIFMFLIVVLFHFLEQEQIEVRKVLSDRGRKVEYAIDALMPKHDLQKINERKLEVIKRSALKDLQGVPRLAVDLSNSGRQRTRKALKELCSLKNWKIHIFYYYQYVLLVLAILYFCVINNSFFENENKHIKYINSIPSICVQYEVKSERRYIA